MPCHNKLILFIYPIHLNRNQMKVITKKTIQKDQKLAEEQFQELKSLAELQKPHIIERDLFNDVVVTRKNIIGEKSEDTGTS